MATGYSLKEMGNEFRAGIDSSSEVDGKISTAIAADNTSKIMSQGDLQDVLCKMPLRGDTSLVEGQGSSTFAQILS